MAETTEPRQKNIVERLADVGEGAIQRLGSAPGSDKVASTLGGMRDRLDELQRRSMRVVAEMDKRIATLEERVDRLEGKKPSAKAAASGAKAATATAEDSPAAKPSKKGDSSTAKSGAS